MKTQALLARAFMKHPSSRHFLICQPSSKSIRIPLTQTRPEEIWVHDTRPRHFVFLFQKFRLCFNRDGTWTQRAELKALGAGYDAQRKRWYVPAGRDVAPFRRWLTIVT